MMEACGIDEQDEVDNIRKQKNYDHPINSRWSLSFLRLEDSILNYSTVTAFAKFLG